MAESTRSSRASARRAASAALPKRCCAGIPRSPSWPWSLRSRRSCPAERRAPMASTAWARVLSCRSGIPRSRLASSACRRTKRRRWCSALRTANELIDISRLRVPRFDVRLTGMRSRVRTAHGLQVPIDPAGKWRSECVIVPAIGFKMPGPLEQALARPDVRDAAAALREWNVPNRLMTAACIGTFILAESGILNAHDATTTWVAVAAVPSTLSRGSTGRIQHDRAVGPLRHRWSGAEPHGPRAVADSTDQSAARRVDRAVPDRRLEALPVGLRLERSPRALGSRRAEIRNLGARAAPAGILARRCGQGRRHKQADAVASHAVSDGKVAAGVAAKVGYADGATLRTLLRRELNVGVKQIRKTA